LPGAPELAVICTPPATVAGLITELAAKGTRAAVVLSAGMTPAQRQDMLDAARPRLLRLLGPNCIGLLAPHIGLNASFAHINAQPGELAFVSQSGALVTAMLDWADAQRIGFSHFVSLGEHADVDFGDMLDYLATDARTRAILLYVESIESPRKFMSAARAAARNKPVIVIKSGRSAQGQKAAASHTGALAGSDAVYDAAIARAGMLRVNSLQELFLAAETLARFRTNRSESLTILTNGGGAGVMAADAAAQVNVPSDRTGRIHAGAAGRGAAGQLVARQPGRHHWRCAGQALWGGTADPAQRPERRSGAVHPRADGHRAECRDRHRVVGVAPKHDGVAHGLLAGRPRRGGRAADLQGSRHCRLSDTRGGGAGLLHVAELPPQPGRADGGATGAACGHAGRGGAGQGGRQGHRACSAVQWTRDAQRSRGQGGAGGLPHPRGGHARRAGGSGCRRPRWRARSVFPWP
jgi:succinyl-CoA synthetase alpha subunit